jgi:D-alanyl-D-alanine dipeptidase
MELSKNFTLEELTVSDTGKKMGLDNTPKVEQIDNLKALCEQVLQPVRDKLGVSVKVNSGYRSPEVNKAIGGAATSQHQKGEAADITLGSKDGNKLLYGTIKELGKYDQLIDEKDYQWVHVSWKKNGVNRKQELHLK